MLLLLLLSMWLCGPVNSKTPPRPARCRARPQVRSVTAHAPLQACAAMLAKSTHTCTYSFRSMLNTFTRSRRVVRHFILKFLMSKTLLDARSGELVHQRKDFSSLAQGWRFRDASALLGATWKCKAHRPSPLAAHASSQPLQDCRPDLSVRLTPPMPKLSVLLLASISAWTATRRHRTVKSRCSCQSRPRAAELAMQHLMLHVAVRWMGQAFGPSDKA
mmetsp:Transcript_154702/g.494689  ORF Transcript_154702/g.494689 Transcript_154702/m.494689 type:complete len:218 (+) Transcript_154702:158-811(+)